MYRWVVESFFPAIICTAVIVGSMQLVSAQVRSSASYQLQSDSINIGGGFSSSTNYLQESTVGEIATGLSSSTNYSLRAGYQQMQEVFISMTDPADVTMDTDLLGITGGTSNGSTTFTVTTDSPSGYQVTMVADGDPAMQRVGGGTDISDYLPTNYPAADTSFTTGAGDAHFGFNPRGVDIALRYQTDGADCGVAPQTESECWDGASTTALTIVEGSGANHPSGATTTIYFRVGIGGSSPVTAGLYIATTTLTAIPL